MDKQGGYNWTSMHFKHCSEAKKQIEIINFALKEHGLTKDNITVMTQANGVNNIYSNI